MKKKELKQIIENQKKQIEQLELMNTHLKILIEELQKNKKPYVIPTPEVSWGHPDKTWDWHIWKYQPDYGTEGAPFKTEFICVSML